MINGLIAQAANIKRPNSAEDYNLDMFLAAYPQFSGNVPDEILEEYVEMVLGIVNRKRFGAAWKRAIGLYLAHVLTLYLQTAQPEGTETADIVSAASSVGMITGESADGVSYSRDNSAVSDLAGWADFKTTAYGVQFATLAKLYARGGSYVW